MLNGDGLRVVLWVAGCNHCCKECQNPVTWDPNGGLPFDQAAKQELFDQLDKSYTSGITFSGGDPLYPGNRMEVTGLAKEIREKYPEKTIWLYTGDLFESFRDTLSFLPLIDVIVDGPYVEALRDVNLRWRGSKNQRVIDVKQTLATGKVVLWARN